MSEGGSLKENKPIEIELKRVQPCPFCHVNGEEALNNQMVLNAITKYFINLKAELAKSPEIEQNSPQAKTVIKLVDKILYFVASSVDEKSGATE